eukprot:scaffold648213_cov55-Attheya_sp.AAC.1
MFSHGTFDGIAPPFWSVLAPTDETDEAILYTVCVKHSRIHIEGPYEWNASPLCSRIFAGKIIKEVEEYGGAVDPSLKKKRCRTGIGSRDV